MSCGALNQEQLKSKLELLAQEISDDLSQLESEQSKALLSGFVSELFLAAARDQQARERRQRQAEGIAAAKARGVRFGRTANPLPENYEELYLAWRGGEMSLTQAASLCGMTRTAFYNAAQRREQAGEACAG